MKILVAYDGSISADTAIDDLHRAGLPEMGEALVVCVADGNVAHAHHQTVKNETGWLSELSEAETLAEGAAGRMGGQFPQWKVAFEALWGSPANVIMKTIGSWHPDLVVVGSHGRSAIARVFLGSVSLSLVHRAPCSVRVVRTPGILHSERTRIVVGDDGSGEAEYVIRSIAERNWPAKTEVRIVSVVQSLVPVLTGLEASTFAQEPAFTVVQRADESERSRLHSVVEAAADVLHKAGLIVSFTVTDGIPGEVIVAEAEQSHADVVFVGARGLSGLDRVLLGSVSTHVVTHAHCAVEVVRKSADEA